MSEPQQIRISDLARELEIKTKVLVQNLSQIGMAGASHSSWIATWRADIVRKHFRALREARVVTRTSTLGAATQTSSANSEVGARGSSGLQVPTREQLLARIAELEAQLRISGENANLPHLRTVGGATIRTHRVISCPHCGAQLRADNLSRHISERCPKLRTDFESGVRARLRERYGTMPETRRRKRKRKHEEKRRAVLCQGGLPSLGKRR